MRAIKGIDKGKIKVADITLAQLSRGLYRSNATVFKELVNNAYDADATEVRLHTNYPEFDFLSCSDNGKGMPLKNFINHFSDEGIGSSVKRKGNVSFTEKYKRPIIGRLGIGMMAVGQLCHSFELESHYLDEHDKGHAYKGRIVLTDGTIPILSEEEKKESYTGKDINVGEWNYEQIEFNQDKIGFSIYSNDVRGTFSREMKKSFDTVDPKLLPFSREKIIDMLYSNTTVRECKPYLETMWELANLCPLPYLDNEQSPIHLENNKKVEIIDKRFNAFIKKRNKALKKYKFNLFFDGVELKRFIQLPTDPVVKSKLYYINFERVVFDTNLKFSGYIFSQISKAIYPQELNGIQIRLRNVGIGGHDSTFLKYYNRVETIRSKWVTGEVFVDEGLEGALNIDRDSFNEHEEHYKMIQKEIHDHLDQIFTETSRAAYEAGVLKRDAKTEEIYSNLKQLVKDETSGKFQLYEENIENCTDYVVIDEKQGKVIINTGVKAIKKKRGDQVFKLVELAYQVSAILSKKDSERYKKFTQFLKKVIEELV